MSGKEKQFHLSYRSISCWEWYLSLLTFQTVMRLQWRVHCSSLLHERSLFPGAFIFSCTRLYATLHNPDDTLDIYFLLFMCHIEQMLKECHSACLMRWQTLLKPLQCIFNPLLASFYTWHRTTVVVRRTMLCCNRYNVFSLSHAVKEL